MDLNVNVMRVTHDKRNNNFGADNSSHIIR